MIDIHTHLAFYKTMSPGFLDGIVNSISEKGGYNKKLISKMFYNSLQDSDCSKLITQMNEAGIQKSVLLIADYGYTLGEAELSIEEIHELHAKLLNQFPNRLAVFAGVDPRRGSSGIRLFERSVKEYGFSGLKLYPPCGFELDDPLLIPYYEICDAYRIPVLTHTGPSLTSMTTEKRYPESVLTVTRQFPKVPFILAHAGIRDISTTIRIAQERENVYCDISGFEQYFGQIEKLQRELCRIVKSIPHRVIFGSDWPLFSLSGTQKKWINSLLKNIALTKEELDGLLHVNAQSILLKQ